MGVIAADANEFPKVIIVEGAAPGTPPAGMIYAYVLSDSLLYWKDDTGTVHGPVATLDDISAPSLALDDLTDVDAPTPTDLDVLTWDDGAGEWIAAAAGGGGGGGGGSILEAPNFGDATGWTNVGATPTVDFGALVADHCYITKTPPNSSTDAYYGAYRAWSPTAGDKVRVMLRARTLTGSTQAAGIFVANSGSGKALLWEAYGSAPHRYHWRAMSSLTGSVNDADTGVQAGLDGAAGQAGIFGPLWLELEYTSATSYQLRYSHDGFTYVGVVANKAPDSAFTPDSWGVHVYAYGDTTPMKGLFQRWEEL